MDSEQQTLIVKSFESAAPHAVEVAEMFYGRLFEINPALRPLFKGDMKEQGRKLMAMLATVVGNLHKLEAIVPAVRALGARHATYGVRDEDYASVASALLWTFEQALGEAFTPATRDAWVAAYTILAGQMQDAAHAAAPPKPILKTRLTETFSLDSPFVNAGMAFIAQAELAAAVCKAGGLGMIGVAAMSPDELTSQIRTIRAGSNRAFGIDIIARFSPPEHIDVLLAEKPSVVTFFWDAAPDGWIARLREAGVRVWVQIGSVAEAKAALAEGVDGLVVQGSEAGGHNRASAGLLSLLPVIRDLAPDLTLIAAGGIADARSAAAALALGADGVWVGTPDMLGSVEANAHEEYKRRVLAAEVHDTARHLVFGPEFPDASVRGLKNRIVREWGDRVSPFKTATPEETPVIGEADIYGQKMPMTRFCGFPATRGASGDFEEMSLLAGESVGQTNQLLPAETIIRDMMEGAAAIIKGRLMAMTAA